MKKVVFTISVLLGIGIAVGYYYWRQATQIPKWYTAQSENTATTIAGRNSLELSSAKARAIEKINSRVEESSRRSPSQPVEVELNPQDVSELVTAKIAEKVNNGKVIPPVSAIRTTIQDGRIESGTVVNLSELPKNQLDENQNAAIEKIVNTFPPLKDRDVYVGISGKPLVENGQLEWDDNTKIKLGNLCLSINELAQRLGVSPEKLKQELNLSSQIGRLKVSDLELKSDRVLLKGSANSER
ncbi:MAG TPA: hypothetical protein V6C85_18485 [Allocoleopsis sp.]